MDRRAEGKRRSVEENSLKVFREEGRKRIRAFFYRRGKTA